MLAIPLRVPFGSVKISLSALQRLWEELNVEVQEQRKIEQHNAKLFEPEDEMERELSEAFRVACIVTYSDSRRQVYYRTTELTAPPEHVSISQIILTNILPYKQVLNNGDPYHQFEILFDFSNPSLAQASANHSEPTANASGFLIGGDRTGWRAGIDAAVRRHVRERNRLWTKFHGQFTYDVALSAFGLPFALWACWRLEPVVNSLFGGMNAVVVGGAYIYIGFCALWLFRVAFAYTRWAFPKVELAEQASPSKTHRGILGTAFFFVAGSIAASALDLPVVGKLASALLSK